MDVLIILGFILAVLNPVIGGVLVGYIVWLSQPDTGFQIIVLSFFMLSLYGIGPASVGYILCDVFHHVDELNHISPGSKRYTRGCSLTQRQTNRSRSRICWNSSTYVSAGTRCWRSTTSGRTCSGRGRTSTSTGWRS